MLNLEFLTPTFIISVLIALSVHEWAHGFVAFKLGDPTAKYDGRLTVNPIAHLDPIGTVLFLMVGFGWGKPVPVDPRYFSNPKRDTALVAVAGPISNLVLAFVGMAALLIAGQQQLILGMTGVMVPPPEPSVAMQLLADLGTDFLYINLVLMAFNLLPIAPLDGSKIIRPFVPLKYEMQYLEFMSNGPKILLILIILGHLMNFPILSIWINFIISPVLQVFYLVANLF